MDATGGEHAGPGARWRAGLAVLVWLALCVPVALLVAPPALGEQSAIPEALGEKPVLFSADEVVHDEKRGLVIATGHVEITHEGRTLLADRVTYNLRQGLVTASGNVSLIDPDGTAYFAQSVELSEDLATGFARDLGVLMTDKTRIAAASAERREGRVTEFHKVVFSPCALCREDPTRAPLWQLKADRVIHDQEKQTLVYRNARMEIFGVPVAYTPYFSHPDPTVERQSGFLAPTIGSSSLLGLTLQVPYYWNISPERDATFEPIFTTKQSVVLAGQYRELFPNGRLEVEGSATVADRDRGAETDHDQLRGHIDATGRFDINEDWRWGFDLERASDDTYLRLYDFSDERSLTTNLFAESLSGRDYLAVNGFWYQGLREEDRNEEFPIVLPLIDYNYLSEPDSLGGRFSLDTNFGLLYRIEGRDTGRLSMRGGWDLPFVGPLGDVYRLMARVQADGYWTEDFDPHSPLVDPPGDTGTDFSGRIFPQIAAQWRYPLIRPASWGSQILEPIVQLVGAPDTANNSNIPNEDSLGFEFDDTNLLSLNRFTGVDRVDPGSRVDYGMKWTVSSPYIGQTSAFVGQSFRIEQDDAFAPGSGLDEQLSDIVGRVRVTPHEDIDLSYRFRFDQEDFDSERMELDLGIGPPALRLDLAYTYLSSDTSTGLFDTREELAFSMRSRLNENWSIFGGHRRDLQANRSLSSAIGLTYQDECFLITLEGERTQFEDREIDPENKVLLKVVFKHLGEISVD